MSFASSWNSAVSLVEVAEIWAHCDPVQSHVSIKNGVRIWQSWIFFYFFFFSLVVLLFALLLLEPVWWGKRHQMASSLVHKTVGKVCTSHLNLLSSGLCWIELERGAPLSSAQGRRGMRMEDVTACLMGSSCSCMELKHGPLPRPNANVLLWGSIPALLFPEVSVVYGMSFRLLSVIKVVHCFLIFSVASSSGSLN